MMSFRDFLSLGTADNTTQRHGTNTGNFAPQSNIQDVAKAFWYAKDASTEEELEQKLKEYAELQCARVVKVYVYGDGDEDFLEDREDAEMLADPGFKIRPSLARVVDEKMTLMSKNEMRQYFKDHPNTTPRRG